MQTHTHPKDMEQVDIAGLARLLAQENIAIEFSADIPTPMFETESRTLLLPIWDCSEWLRHMMVIHEVGHASITPRGDVVDAAHLKITKALWGQGFNHETANLSDADKMRLKIVQQFLNIFEDHRVDRRQKRKYPGCRLDYVHALDELIGRGFFGFKCDKKDVDAHINKMGFPDRLNMYGKTNNPAGVNFSDAEKPFVTLMENTQSFDDVVEAVISTMKYCQEQAKTAQQHGGEDGEGEGEGQDGQQKKKSKSSKGGSGKPSKAKSGQKGQKAQPAEGEGDDLGENQGANAGEGEDEGEGQGSGQGDEGEDEGEGQGSGQGEEEGDGEAEGKGQGNGDGQGDDDAGDNSQAADGAGGYQGGSVGNIETRDAFDKAMESLRAQSKNNQGYNEVVLNVNSPVVDLPNAIQPNSVFMEKTEWVRSGNPGQIKKLNKFLNDNRGLISALVNEFEMKKAADVAKKTFVSKTGVLDTNLLKKYRFSDDVFKKNTIVPEGKNHGFVMLLDWSGSMSSEIKEVVKNIVIMATFFRRIGVPFDLYTFDTPGYTSNRMAADMKNRSEDDNYLTVEGGRLVHMLTSGVSALKFRQALEAFWILAQKGGSSEYQMGGTPLLEALQCMPQILTNFKKKYQVQVMNLLVYTDGDANNVQIRPSQSWTQRQVLKMRTSGAAGIIPVPYFIDKKLGMSIDISEPGNHRQSYGQFGTKAYYNLDQSKLQAALLERIKLLFDMNVIGFFLHSNMAENEHYAEGMIKGRLQKYYTQSEIKKIMEHTKAAQSLAKNGFAVTPYRGYDKFFHIRPVAERKNVSDVVSNSNDGQLLANLVSNSRAYNQLAKHFVDAVVE